MLHTIHHIEGGRHPPAACPGWEPQWTPCVLSPTPCSPAKENPSPVPASVSPSTRGLLLLPYSGVSEGKFLLTLPQRKGSSSAVDKTAHLLARLPEGGVAEPQKLRSSTHLFFVLPASWVVSTEGSSFGFLFPVVSAPAWGPAIFSPTFWNSVLTESESVGQAWPPMQLAG